MPGFPLLIVVEREFQVRADVALGGPGRNVRTCAHRLDATRFISDSSSIITPDLLTYSPIVSIPIFPYPTDDLPHIQTLSGLEPLTMVTPNPPPSILTSKCAT